MRIVIVSDTHGSHEELGTLSGDVLIHCGDFCDGFNPNRSDIDNTDRWFAKQQFEAILCVGGNHDFVAEELESRNEPVFEHATYLTDSSTTIGGIHFYGAPWVPELDRWAYFLPDAELKQKWDLIPENTDVLITHTPPLGILDKPRSGISIGCSHLRAKLENLDLLIHCFGHVHASYGQLNSSKTRFVNATVVDSDFVVANQPVTIDL